MYSGYDPEIGPYDDRQITYMLSLEYPYEESDIVYIPPFKEIKLKIAPSLILTHAGLGALEKKYFIRLMEFFLNNAVFTGITFNNKKRATLSQIKRPISPEALHYDGYWNLNPEESFINLRNPGGLFERTDLDWNILSLISSLQTKVRYLIDFRVIERFKDLHLQKSVNGIMVNFILHTDVENPKRRIPSLREKRPTEEVLIDQIRAVAKLGEIRPFI